jgi:hypothetical protein
VFKANYRGQEVAAKLLNSQMDKRLIAEFHRCAAATLIKSAPHVASHLNYYYATLTHDWETTTGRWT